jgi:hypothetical protein
VFGDFKEGPSKRGMATHKTAFSTTEQRCDIWTDAVEFPSRLAPVRRVISAMAIQLLFPLTRAFAGSTAQKLAGCQTMENEFLAERSDIGMEAPVVYLIENSMHILRARASARRLSAVSVERFNSLVNSGGQGRIAAGTAKRTYHVPFAHLNKWLA